MTKTTPGARRARRRAASNSPYVTLLNGVRSAAAVSKTDGFHGR